MNNISDQEKHDYLTRWHWETEQHPDGFLIYSHRRFPGVKYKLNSAYQKMKENQPSLEPVLVIQNDDPNGIDKLKNFMKENGII